MAARNIHYYLIKLVRLTGWLLFFLMLGYIGTGFSLCGKLGFEKLLNSQTAKTIHQVFDWPLVSLFTVHSAATIYFALRRWGWIKKKP